MIAVVADARPTCDLSNAEIVAYLFRSLRAQEMKSAKQVRAELRAMFPDLPPERARECLVQLAQTLQGMSSTQVFS